MRSALQFLTILPIRATSGAPGEGAWAFAIVGALLGLIAAALWPWTLGPLTAIIALAVLTGGLHEDGLADVCDALRGYRSREKMLEILKDSRIGAHGALALIASFTFRWQALARLQGDAWLRLPAAYGISRGAMVLLAELSPPAGAGLGRAFVDSTKKWAVWLTAAQILALAALTGWPTAAWLLGCNAIALIALRRWFIVRLGGVTGDCLGAMCQVSEAVSLGVLACL